MQQAVICKNITKKFGEDIIALNGITIEVNKGEFMLLVGPSGCGKTTLLSVIAGILSADSGNCAVLGSDYGKLSNGSKIDFRAKNIGFIFQSYNLLPSLTVAENVAVPLIINGVERHLAVRKAEALLAEVGLKGRGSSMPHELSGGQQQRVAIARAIIHEPGLVLCDEPTSALDHETGMKILGLMKDLCKKRGTTFVIVTHDNRIFEFADRIARMDDGVIERISSKEG